MRHSAERWTERPHLLTLTMGVATVLFVGACLWLAAPFLPALTWSCVPAVVGYPLYARLSFHKRYPNVTAALVVMSLTLVLIGPVLVLGVMVANQIHDGLQTVQEAAKSDQWQSVLNRHPRLSRLVQAVQDQVNVQQQLEAAAGEVGKAVPGLVGGSIWIGMQLLITLFLFFYFVRDRDQIVDWLRRVIPLSHHETTLLFGRLRGALHSVVVGNLLTSLLQGILGGMMMGFLGFSLPVLWGSLMAIFSLIPTLGAPVVWIPAAIWLAAQGSVGKALVLTAWGAGAVGLIDNWLYPILVGRGVAFHTVPIFLALLGGVVLFGVSGLVLGPLIMTVAWTLLEIWRQRTANGRAATEAVKLQVNEGGG